MSVRALALVVSLGIVASSAGLDAEELPELTGRPLGAAVTTLSRLAGVDVVFSETVLLPSMRVERQPDVTEPLDALVEILLPHGLGLEEGPGGRRVVVALPTSSIVGTVVESLGGTPLGDAVVRIDRLGLSTRTDERGRFELAGVPIGVYSVRAELAGAGATQIERVTVEVDRVTRLQLSIDLSLTSEEIVVSPSTISIYRRQPTSLVTLDEEELGALPIAGDDHLRAAKLLPGITGADFTARANIRGGRSDEVLVLLDGLELVEPYHLPDFEEALSIVPPSTLERTDVISGGFSAVYGDRMSGVIEMTTVRAGAERRSHLGLSTLDSHLGAIDRFAEGAGEWMLSGRVSTADPAADQADLEEDPRYWDLFGKLGYAIAPDQNLHLEWLEAHDDLRFTDRSAAGLEERIRTDYRHSSVWMGHDAVLGSETSIETILFATRLDRDREGLDLVPPRFTVDDRRRLDSYGIRHHGTTLVRPSLAIEWGVEGRSLTASYDYRSSSETRRLEPNREPIDFDGRFVGRQYAAFASTRWDLADSVVLELGARFDENEITDDAHVSPRLSLAWAAGNRSVLRLAWGHYYQSQRAYELPVEDGETAFSTDERAVSTVVSWERSFTDGVRLRIEAYDKAFSNPRPRYENLFDPVSRFPEVEADRVRIAPERSRGRGVELLLRRNGTRLDWMASYAYSRIEDEIDGRDIPRAYDQPHALQLAGSYRPADAWTLGATFVYHTGWPTTAVELGTDPTGEPELRLGPLYGKRLGDYRRLDVRLARSWTVGRGRISLYLEVLNALETENVRGLDYSIVSGMGSEPALEKESEHWLGTVPILGVDWEF